MLPIIIAALGLGTIAVLASRKNTVPQGALPGCSWNVQDLHAWGEKNGVTVLISDPRMADGYNSVGAHNGPVLYWEPGSTVLMVRVAENEYTPDWHAVNSYCRYNLAQGRVGRFAG